MLQLLSIAVLTFAAISPLLQIVGAPFFFDHQITLHSKADPALRSFLAQSSTAITGEVRVLLVFSDLPSPQQMRELRELGVLESFTGHVATMHLPGSLLPQVASLDFVDRVSYPRTLSTKLDGSVPEILADKVWETVRDTEGNYVNGTGVVIGIVDTGIDLTHRDFYFGNGTSKLLYLWDQSAKGNSPQGFDYGNQCTRVEIQAYTCSEIDGETNGFSPGHGTAVAAVAASSGESGRLFESCLRYDGARWHNDTGICGDSNAQFVLLAGGSDYRYFGASYKFNQIFFDVQSPGHYENIVWEYSQGLGSWGPLLVESNQTSGFAQSGTVFFAPPSDWGADAVDGTNHYWVRMKAARLDKPAIIGHIQENPPYRGVAPAALLIPVKLRDGSDDSVVDGVNYIVKKARELDLPFVINYSFGDSLGSHDGTEPVELAFTDFASNGVPIVVVAGNSRDANLHVSGRLLAGQSVTVPWSTDQAQNYVDLWYPANDVLGISVRTPNGTVVSGPTRETGVNTPFGNVAILADKRTTGKEWGINITSTSEPGQQPETWSFTLTATTVEDGRWDAWTEPGKFSTPERDQTSLYKIDPSDTIDSPGTARGVITVGSYMTKYFWHSGCSSCIDYTTSIGKRGVWWVITEASQVGNITFSSGMGPTRDGRTKPEIVGPGANIAAARAFNRPPRYSDPDNYHQIFRGTSFAAPHVTGTIALMLQMNRYLSPNEIRTILTEDARQDKFTGSIDKLTGSSLWGWGKLNALNSTRDAPSLYTATVEIEPVEIPLFANLTLDGQNIQKISLNQTRRIVLEFRRGENHTMAPSLTIQVDPGTRYALVEAPWNFSAGGVRRFHYQLQFYLHVKSAFSYPTGTGWYKANSTAIASVVPPVAEGYEFSGWIGAISSDSPTVQVKMDSSKEIVAVWRPVHSPLNIENIIGVALAIAISLAVALVVRYKMPKRT